MSKWRGHQRADTSDRSVEFIKCLFDDHCGNLGGCSTKRLVFINEHNSVRLADGVKHRFFIQRADGAKIEHLGIDIVFTAKNFRRFERDERRSSMAYQ